ncbi:PAAR domain-containing protein [Microvirga splendida]|uniref:PAAR domain-containing protein n=1 Tax=Microvirga splendida TaxID=2795727 RepID=A0ABS0Y4F9_9HYPH|nr:PAAR domain-containing protein [Microvirga splendida]MBJ6127194.1 PAAR domain-containing protein [Microvirga splendida]
MGLSAARFGDLTSHGGLLAPGPGCPTVLIEGKPAWRVGLDAHLCPVASPQPHGGGAVMVGSATVLIGGAPATRVGDMVVEAAGGPNPIVMGAATVLIG